MLIKDLKVRWRSAAETESASEHIFNVCKNGGVLSMDESPFGRLENDLVDFRGYPAHRILVKDVTLKDLDLSYTDFSSTWIESNHFENCLFVRTDFTDASDHANIFENCVFLDCKFKLAVLGYKGTRYRDCVFTECGFQRTNFIRPEFVNSDFVNCRLKSIDFNASSFENCKFEGLLEDVWFRGTFPSQSQIESFGRPKINKMENVSFENADLKDLTISDGCNLSTVVLKNNGRYFKYDNWNERIHFLKNKIDHFTDQKIKYGINLFVKVFSVGAETQDWMIISLDDLQKSYGGSAAAQKIIDILDSASVE